MGEYEFIRGYIGEWNTYDEINRENTNIYLYICLYKQNRYVPEIGKV